MSGRKLTLRVRSSVLTVLLAVVLFALRRPDDPERRGDQRAMTPTVQPSEVRGEHREEMRLNTSSPGCWWSASSRLWPLLVVGVILTVARPRRRRPCTPPPSRTSPSNSAALEPGRLLSSWVCSCSWPRPFARVVALGIAFARRRQWLFAGISLVVMAMLILGAVLGLSLG